MRDGMPILAVENSPQLFLIDDRVGEDGLRQIQWRLIAGRDRRPNRLVTGVTIVQSVALLDPAAPPNPGAFEAAKPLLDIYDEYILPGSTSCQAAFSTRGLAARRVTSINVIYLEYAARRAWE